MTTNLWAKDLLNVWLLPVYIINIPFHDQSSPFGINVLRVIPILTHYSDIVSDRPSGCIYNIWHIYSDILSGSLSGMLSGIYSDILFGIFSCIHSGSLSHLFSHSVWDLFWHFFLHILCFDILSGTLTFSLACVRVQAWTASGAGNKDFGSEARRNKGQGMECRDPHLAGGEKDHQPPRPDLGRCGLAGRSWLAKDPGLLATRAEVAVPGAMSPPAIQYIPPGFWDVFGMLNHGGREYVTNL